MGKGEIRRHFREIRELTGGTFRTAVHDVLARDNHAVGLIEAEGERRGRKASLPRVHVWHVRGGLLTELWLHPTDQYAFDDFWAQRERIEAELLVLVTVELRS